ncbi:hypothetical protein [Tardiphaga sp. 841_E9_N1_2]|jgi:hypothetical protein|uniref:hypothetical protein n=1 Tax=Tardiphaga sp. 841_E9_N1_2 TaxID=3240762 RepID=UPI003F1E7F9E
MERQEMLVYRIVFFTAWGASRRLIMSEAATADHQHIACAYLGLWAHSQATLSGWISRRPRLAASMASIFAKPPWQPPQDFSAPN